MSAPWHFGPCWGFPCWRGHAWPGVTYFVFERAILDEIDGDDTVLEEQPFRALIQRNQLAINRHDGFWHCMDHYKD